MSDGELANGEPPTGKGAPDPDAIKMFVGQIPRTWNETELRLLFDEFGPVFQLSVLRDKATGESRGCCFVTFYHRKDAISSQGALHNIKILPGMHHAIQMKPADSENRNERKLFIGMISKKANEPDVKAMFANFGLIEDCTVLRDTAGNSKGCAFVTFSSRASALNAIKAMHHSRTMEGCSMPLVVKFADTQKDKDQKKTVGPTTNSQQQTMGPACGGQGLMQFGAANVGATSPVLRHSNLLSGGQASVLPSYLSLLQNMPGLAAATGGPMSQAANFQLLSAGQNPNGGLSQSAALNSLGGYYGLNSQLTTNNVPSQVNGVAALINYLLTAAAVSSASGNNSFGANFAPLQAASIMNPVAQSWKPSGLTSTPSLSPSALNGNLIQLTGAGGAATYLPQSYAAGGGNIYAAAAAAAQSPLTASMTGSQNSTKQLEGPEGANLFIYHLPQEFSDTDLAQTFSPFGTMLSAKVFVDKQTNLSKCFGFVSYENPGSATAAIQSMNGFQVGTKRLKVQLKRSKQDSKPYQHPDNVKIKLEDFHGGGRPSI